MVEEQVKSWGIQKAVGKEIFTVQGEYSANLIGACAALNRNISPTASEMPQDLTCSLSTTGSSSQICKAYPPWLQIPHDEFLKLGL